MKLLKALLIFVLGLGLLVFAVNVNAVEWHIANQTTVAWDEVTTLTDGSAIPADSSVKYNVYLVNSVTDPGKTNPAKITDTPVSITEYLLTLNTEGQYYVGVSALRIRISDNAVLTESSIAWSDTPEATNDTPFGVQYYLLLSPPKGLR